ncbi:MAG: porin family protein [Cyclobacteriaceae bacterium]|jgi:hypothetical protein|nr:porin family protein [Cyclobacteriaceae bacterium]
MKIPALLMILFLSLSTFAQSGFREFGIGYTYMAPLGMMKDNIERGNGFTIDYYLTPANNRFSFGIEFSYTLYGHDKNKQVYTFEDGTSADMDIVVDNSYSNLLVAGRYFIHDGSLVRPYISLKAGYSWFRTDLNIYDPDDWDQCEPIDNDILQKDGSFIGSVGAGIQYDLSGIFKKLNANHILFNLNANLVMGGMIKYMNADAPDHNQPGAIDLNARFINTQTQVIHEHHVGNVYQSYLEMVELRAGFIFRKSKY